RLCRHRSAPTEATPRDRPCQTSVNPLQVNQRSATRLTFWQGQHHPPRSQTREPAPHPRWTRENSRLRPRETDGRGTERGDVRRGWPAGDPRVATTPASCSAPPGIWRPNRYVVSED